MRKEAESEADLAVEDLQETWRILSPEDRLEAFFDLPRADAEDFFLDLSARDEHQLISLMPAAQRRSWLRLLPPDDAADVLQQCEESGEREEWLALLDEQTRAEVTALLAYAEDDAGGLMNTRYARVRPDVTADEAIAYLRRQGRDKLENVNYVYVLETDQKLVGVVGLRDLFTAAPGATVRELMTTEVYSARADMDQEALGRLFQQHDLHMIPVVDEAGRMQGIVTVDDIVDVIQEEATEDIHKIGGTEALDAPYLQVGIPQMVQKRVVWLAALFLSEMLTTTAMSRFENEISRAVVLAIFIPLIISSGGNSGSQASTLVIRAMALGEVRLADWWRVIRRELMTGLLM
ncbi:MAG: magnesium transporter, partial [Candidatus Eisenbacteria bacterium]|nr:magnesium transporter [Candidatus Eisenbacteria bacterium]